MKFFEGFVNNYSIDVQYHVTTVQTWYRQIGGDYRSKKKENPLSPGDFENPWNYFALMSLPDPEIYKWLRIQDLLVTNIFCTSQDCTGEMFLRGAANKPGGAVFRCSIDRPNIRNCRCYSFLQKSNLAIQNITEHCFIILGIKLFVV